MLVLSRKAGETIIIDNNVVLEVLEIRGDKVRLGFTADKKIPIVRSEVLERKEKENAAHHQAEPAAANET